MCVRSIEDNPRNYEIKLEVSMSKKGIQQERELVSLLNENGFQAVRIAGSGAGSRNNPKPDVVCINKSIAYAIELKSSNRDVIYIDNKQIRSLIRFCDGYGIYPLVCVKFSYVPFVFLRLRELECTDKGNRRISRETAKSLAECKKYLVSCL